MVSPKSPEALSDLPVRPRTGVRAHPLDDEDTYEQVLENLEGVTGFHRWFFLEALATGFGFRFQPLLVTRGDEPIGLVPIILRSRGPVRYANQMPMPYVGPVTQAGELDSVLAAVEPLLKRERVVATKFSFAPGLRPDLEALRAAGFDPTVEETFVIRCSVPPDERMRQLSGNLRRTIRVLQQRGAECGPSTHDEILECLPALATEAWERQGVPAPTSTDALRGAVERLVDQPDMLWRSVRMDGQFKAMLACNVYGSRAWGWKLAGSRVTGLSPHSLAYWDMIEQCAERGLDFDLSGGPTDGIRNLKSRLGGEVEESIVALRAAPAFARYEAIRRRVASARLRLRRRR